VSAVTSSSTAAPAHQNCLLLLQNPLLFSFSLLFFFSSRNSYSCHFSQVCTFHFHVVFRLQVERAFLVLQFPRLLAHCFAEWAAKRDEISKLLF